MRSEVFVPDLYLDMLLDPQGRLQVFYGDGTTPLRRVLEGACVQLGLKRRPPW